jgi:hypothetical protein
MSNQRQRAQGIVDIGTLAFTDAVREARLSASLKFTPWLSSEASGSPTPLPYRFWLEARRLIESHLSFEPRVDGTGHLLGQDG